MFFHAFSILLSFRFVASNVHRSCQFASYASFPPALGAGLDHGKLGGAFLKRPAVHRGKTETRKASLLAALDDLGKCRILDLSKGEAFGSGLDNDTLGRLYTICIYLQTYIFFFSLFLSNMLISDL